MPRLLLLLVGLAACGGSDLLGIEPPKQKGNVNPMAERGQAGFDQRTKDCYDMPSAAACYEVGTNYEMGLAAEPDEKKALEFYTRACELESQAEHCDAAKRLRDGP